MASSAEIAIIGGSGLYAASSIRNVQRVDVPTPFGMPSDYFSIGTMDGIPVAFLPRHGEGHRLLPSEVPSRANLWALKSLGVRRILSVSAVGSLVEEYAPGDLVLCDQLIDRTSRKDGSFFGGGVAGHVSFAQPFCADMRDRILDAARKAGQPMKARGTLVCMEGPPFSTRAESALHKDWGAQLIGMTALPEARLAREAEICYATVAMVTDYDCWREGGEAVSVDMVVRTMRDTVGRVQALLPGLVAALADDGDCPCRHAARNALMTDPASIPYDRRRALALLYGGYWTP